MKKPIFVLPALFLMCACSGNKAGENSANDENEGVNIESIDLHGEWALTSYSVDSVTTEFGDSVDYRLIVDETEGNFSIYTGCNNISGSFSSINDTIRLHDTLVTEMACDDMTVEQNMLKLVNDPEAYGLRDNDTINYVAPAVGGATFVRIAAEAPAEVEE